MKYANFFSLAALVFGVCFAQNAQAQWLQNATTQTITSNTNFNNAANAVVGIGTANPSNAKLDVQGAIGNTVAMFRKSSSGKGVSLVSDWPGVYFNSYFNGTFKSMSSGYGGIVNFDPNAGRIDFGITPSAAGAANSDISLPIHMSINKDGKVGIGVTADKAKLESGYVPGLNTAAIFGRGAAGVSLSHNWPGIHFNSYFNYNDGGSRALSPGYSGEITLSPDDGKLRFYTRPSANSADEVIYNTSQRMVLTNDGKFGIGTDPGNALLDVGHIPGLNTAAIFGRGAAGVSISHNWPGIHFNSYYNYNLGGSKALSAGFSGELSFDHSEGIFQFMTRPYAFTAEAACGNPTQRMAIRNDGRVVIGNYSGANGYLLSVRGKVICEELKVQLQNAWPDYVFTPGYKLKPLEEVEQHIAEKGHLPNIPSAREMQENGISVGEMQTKMMEKIEELTLYLIDLKKENETLKQRVQTLETNSK